MVVLGPITDFRSEYATLTRNTFYTVFIRIGFWV